MISSSLISFAVVLAAQAPAHGEAKAGGHSAPVAPAAAAQPGAPLFADLGDHHHPIQTRSARAQTFFNQGLTLLYAFNHAEAERSFREAARLDPNCAMAYWGIALSLGPNINKPVTDDAAKAAYTALGQAIDRLQHASPVEREYIAALAQRYAPAPVADRAVLDRAYSDAMQALARRNPDDLDAATLAAEAMMDTMPWNYWEKDGRPKPETVEAIALLERVLAANPMHPGANHYYIHAVEAGPKPESAIAVADRLGAICPGAGHLVHMPSHIYLRVGRYRDATDVNDRAMKADASYLEQCHAQGFYPAAYVSHNVHFLWYTTMMEGQSARAIAAARELGKHLPPEAIRDFPELHGLLPVPLYVMLRFGQWQSVLDEPPLPGNTPFGEAMTHYAKGVALYKLGRADEAAPHVEALASAARGEVAKALDTPQFPGGQLIIIADHLLAAASAAAGGRAQEQVAHLEEAIAIQDALPYMEPPYWYFPVRQALGAALLAQGRAAEAEKTYRDDLGRFPRNGWSLFGLARSLEAQGKTAESRVVLEQFAQAWSRADVVLERPEF